MQTSSSQSLLLTHTPSASSLMLPEKANVVAFREEAIPLITFCPNSQGTVLFLLLKKKHLNYLLASDTLQ